MLIPPFRYAVVSRPQLVGTPTWTDNGDGTATVTYTTSFACYSGIDYGTSAGTYTENANSYITPGDEGSGLYFGTSHEVLVPEVDTLADDTYYYRIAAGNVSYNSLGYIDIERTGDIVTGPGGSVDVITLENDTDGLLMETGDYVLAEGAADVAITDMTAASSLADANSIVGVQSGTTKRFTLSDLKAYING